MLRDLEKLAEDVRILLQKNFERRMADAQRACLIRVIVHVTGGTVAEALEAIRDTSVRFAVATDAPESLRAATAESQGEAWAEAMAEATAKFEAMDCKAVCPGSPLCYARIPVLLTEDGSSKRIE